VTEKTVNFEIDRFWNVKSGGATYLEARNAILKKGNVDLTGEAEYASEGEAV
jgi:hypothetical protein